MMGRLSNERQVSVIIPVYNAEGYLRRCIDSVLSQTYKNFEIICVDDGSVDKSGAILDFYAENTQSIEVFHIKNKGVGNARNLGIGLAKGDYILFIDADDEIEPLLLEKVVKALNKEPADICVFDMILDRYGHIREKPSIRNVKEGNIGRLDRYDTFVDYFLNGPRSACNRAFSRSFLLKESIRFSHLRNGEDGIFITEAYSKAKKIVYLPYAGYHYILNKSSATQASRNEEFIQSICLFYDAACKLAERFPKFDYMKIINTHFVNAYLSTAGDFILTNKPENWEERKKQFNSLFVESPYFTAIENVDFSYLNEMAKLLSLMGKLTYRKIYFIGMVRKTIKDIIKHR